MRNLRIFCLGFNVELEDLAGNRIRSNEKNSIVNYNLEKLYANSSEFMRFYCISRQVQKFLNRFSLETLFSCKFTKLFVGM